MLKRQGTRLDVGELSDVQELEDAVAARHLRASGGVGVAPQHHHLSVSPIPMAPAYPSVTPVPQHQASASAPHAAQYFPQ